MIMGLFPNPDLAQRNASMYNAANLQNAMAAANMQQARLNRAMHGFMKMSKDNQAAYRNPQKAIDVEFEVIRREPARVTSLCNLNGSWL
jgi:hypothetical protein